MRNTVILLFGILLLGCSTGSSVSADTDSTAVDQNNETDPIDDDTTDTSSDSGFLSTDGDTDTHTNADSEPFVDSDTNTDTDSDIPIPTDWDASQWSDEIWTIINGMSLNDKILQLRDQTPDYEKNGEVLIPHYNYWNEALHGVARQGLATSFPQAIGYAATWDPALIYRMATIISDEARIKTKQTGRGLTYWSPTINLARDPRWGRCEESLGEDPFLAGRIGAAFVKGMQGDDPRYLKTVATAKHFVANNHENNRHTDAAAIDERNFYEYYLKPFRELVEDAHVYSVMSAYNALTIDDAVPPLTQVFSPTNEHVPASASSRLLRNILRDEWGFNGFVVSDCGAIRNIHLDHHYTATAPEAVAAGILAGTDLNCGEYYPTYLNEAVSAGLLTEDDIDQALYRVLSARFLTGEFDDPSNVKYWDIPESELASPEHAAVALEVAQKAIVLLKNQNNFLPVKEVPDLDGDQIKEIAVIGPNADEVVLGGYSGTPAYTVSPLQGIVDKVAVQNSSTPIATDTVVTHALGCEVVDSDESNIDSAVSVAAAADIVVIVLGTNQDVADEGNDRDTLALPGVQQKLLEEVYAANPNTVVVLVNGSPLAMTWAQNNVPAMISAWYSGEAQGTAIADVIFGDVNPSGKLTTTWYRSEDDLPDIKDYNIRPHDDLPGRTYMYYEGDVLYPFGYGLSYTTFNYSNLTFSSTELLPSDVLTVSVDIQNSGEVAGDEIVQLYVADEISSVNSPVKELKGFKRISLAPGETRTVQFALPVEDINRWDADADSYVVNPGDYEIQVGGSSAHIFQHQTITIL